MKTPPSALIRAAIGGLALIGLLGVLPISLAELARPASCPHLGPLPACHLVTLAYGAIGLVVLHRRLWTPWLFLAAWLVIFALAATGSALELIGEGTCPKTADGFPKCFLSLGLALALFMPFAFYYVRTRRVTMRHG